MAIIDARLIDLPEFVDDRGYLSYIESSNHIPFEIKRIYYLHSIPNGQTRGAHAHKKLQQFILAVSGSFEIKIDDGVNTAIFKLSKPSKGLYVPPMIWRDINNFSYDAVCLVLASDIYNESDYIRNYDDFNNSL